MYFVAYDERICEFQSEFIQHVRTEQNSEISALTNLNASGLAIVFINSTELHVIGFNV